MLNQQKDWLMKIEAWRENSNDRTHFSEGEAYQLLRRLEEARAEAGGGGNGTPLEELDRAEAVVLTRLAEARMSRPDGLALAEEWLDRARQLDPAYAPAAVLQCCLFLQMLREQSPFQDLPVIRETDNPAARKRQTEALRVAVDEQIRQARLWRTHLERGKAAALTAGEEAASDLYTQLAVLLTELESGLLSVAEQARTYAKSLEGMFYSSESLQQLQKAVRELGEKRATWDQLLAEREESDVGSIEHAPSALEQIDQLIGMEVIKHRVRQLAQFLQYRQLRSKKGWTLRDSPDLHLVLMGNPGTGKTTLARLLARLYHELGLLERDEVIEVDRSHLIGAYVGQTEQRTMEAIKRAVGGVLFIDEAYSLKRADSHGSDYGQVAIDTLVAAMTSGELAGKFVVILAGYPEEMRQFLSANPGLRSRFPETGHFLLPDYSDEELLAIAEDMAQRNDYSLTEEAKRVFLRRIERERVDASFGNARTARNLVLDAIFAKGRQLAETEGHLGIDDFTVLYPEDVAADPCDLSTDREDSIARTIDEQLEGMVGLVEWKAEMCKLAAFLTVQQERQQRGLPVLPVELHAVFSGNPGTGKTTAARLYARILRQVGYLKRGHLVAASRADLVAGYVGQTAIRTKQKVRDALGGVLFIDEAYSLFASSENDFGSEAVDTLVDEMTKHEENLVVVLAGYPAQMERLLASNPGLSSRFKKYYLFADYTAGELHQILLRAAAAKGYLLTEDTGSAILAHLQKLEQEQQLHGNARFVHNLLQEAIQHQAVRLVNRPLSEQSAEILQELRWEDFAPLFPAVDGVDEESSG
ncbi:AAA family ATPase [Brevibacillus humidisoli]|uniref:AAA family ATPase n=1 Tax=Brevibacillus humidisoli TaxID=2895522 RepID=UPI001E505B10|nr:AAA family ATPase [Brevibacillus humidisoli]UFJ42297.1 AAA family ATPase [Brevibacillus humidisoli]